MTYELGKQYEMRVVDLRIDSAGNEYVLVVDDSNPSFEIRIYNILKCQKESLPETMYVQVYHIDEFERVKFRQDEARLIREHYKEGKLYPFTVTDVREDFNTKVPYYVLEDEFTSHRYYFKGEQRLQLGDDCILEVAGFTDKGFLDLKEIKHYDANKVEHAIDKNNDSLEQRLRNAWRSLPIVDVGDESDTLELKTSIVFTPDKGEADIEKQLSRGIVREIVGFMNKQGGKLYIGISDKEKRLVGIETDYNHLNDGNDEKNDFYYHPDRDGYELKIRHTIDKLCPSVANSLIDFEFVTEQNLTYCIINVKRAKRPIFMNGNMLYQRQGNQVKLLKGDEITFFVTERMTVSIRDMVDNDGEEMNLDAMKEMMRELLNERSYVPVDIPPQRQVGEIENWIVWYNDGTWKRKRDKSDEANVSFQLPVFKELKDGLLAFCYDNNKVNVIYVKEFQKKVAKERLESKKPGWSRKGKPMNIFLMHPTDYLVGYSIDGDGIQHVKLQSISDLGTTGGAINEGNLLLPSGHIIQAYAILGSEHKKKVEHLIVPKRKKTSDAGPALSSPTLQGEIEYLKKVLEQK